MRGHKRPDPFFSTVIVSRNQEPKIIEPGAQGWLLSQVVALGFSLHPVSPEFIPGIYDLFIAGEPGKMWKDRIDISAPRITSFDYKNFKTALCFYRERVLPAVNQIRKARAKRDENKNEDS